MQTLETKQRFPELEAPSTDGSAVRLPDAVAGHASVLIFYRGHW